VVLRYRTVITKIYNSFQDRPNGSGIEVVLCWWLLDAVLEDVVASLREHQAVKFSNWLESAYRGALLGIVLLSKINHFDYLHEY
jgi:hypothetical protein